MLEDIRFEHQTARCRHRQQRRAGGDHERLPGSVERRADCFDRSQIGFGRAREFSDSHQLVFEGQMDDAIACACRFGETIDVVERATKNLDTCGHQRGSGRIGACESDDGVAAGKKVRNQSRADMAGTAGDEKTHTYRGVHFTTARSGSANTNSALPLLGRLMSGASSIGIVVPQLAAPPPTGTATYCRPPTE